MIKSINTKLSRTLLLLISFAMLFFITACGGSKDESTTTNPSTGSSISISSTVTSLAAGESSIITATVTDGAGAPVQGKTVTFTLLHNNSGATSTTLNGGRTDAQGQAIATYTAGANSPTTTVQDIIQASVTGAAAAATITRISSSSAATGFRMTLTADSTSLAAGQSTVVTATVTDGSGSPAGGQAVTLTLLNNNSGATLTILSLGVTDNSGQAQAIYTAGANSPTTSVQDTIQASVTGAAGVIIITRLSSSTALTGFRMTLTADSISLSAGNSTIIKATITNGSGTPSAGQTVTFAFLHNNSGATLVPLNGGVTDASGQAIATYTAGAINSAASVQDMIQASVTGTTGAVIITRVSSSTTLTGLRMTLTAAAISLAAGESTIITATVNDGSGSPVQGQPVAFSFVTHPSGASLTILSATTDAAGEATALYTAGGTTPNATVQDVVQASVTGTTKAVIITRTAGTGSGTTSNGTLALSVSSSVVTFGTPITITGTLRDADGALVPNAVVTFAAQSSLVAFTPSSATALTNASGVASITLDAASIDSSGATYISASAPITAGGTTSTITSTPVGIAVNGAAITLGALTLGQPSISSYGTSSVSVPVFIDGSPATVPISVNFTSACVASDKATLSSPVTSNAVTGIANSTYKDNNCNSGTDLITASVIGGAHASATITVVPPATSNIKFISATPEIIGTSTASSALLSKSSVVKFQVVDSNNYGKSGVGVTFSLLPANYSSLGITFSPDSATSDADGYVTTSVTSGTVPTPVWVVATVTSAPAIHSQSNTLTITTGLPTENFFSLSVSTYNIEGWSYDGTKSTLTILASDRLGNPVPDGTVVNFIAEGGDISNGAASASCTTTDGVCTITFKSAEYRPSNGRVTILAYALGEKSFVDSDGNNAYTPGETFYDLGDLYLDTNENGVWDPGEQYISYQPGSLPCQPQPSGTYPSSYRNVHSKENTCTGTWGINYVRRDAVLTLSGSAAYITAPHTVNMGSSCVATFSKMLMDINNNPMPAGTTIAIANNNVYYRTFGNAAASADVIISGGTPVLSTNALGGTSIAISVSGGTACSGNPVLLYPQGSVNVVVTTPNGIITTIPFTVTANTTTIIPNVTLAADSTSVTALTGTANLTATVTDQYGYPIVGQTVTFSITTNNSGGSLNHASVTTNASGLAAVKYYAGPTPGNDTITAVAGTSSDFVVITVTP
jgi:protocatechuate 3,4-dioxygenase beta subunit